VDLGSVIALVTGILGVAGLCFTALRFNRDDTTAIVSQQSNVLHDMAALNEDLRQTAADLRTERDGLRSEVAELREQVQQLRHER
jgi:uncharacterized coiled-coil DUF342 family protein